MRHNNQEEKRVNTRVVNMIHARLRHARIGIVAFLFVVSTMVGGSLSSPVVEAVSGNFGVSTIGGVAENFNYNYKISDDAVAPASGLIDSLSFYIDGKASTSGSSTLAAAVYSDVNGEPNSLLGSSGTKVIAAGQNGAWITFDLTSPLSVVAGQRYWLTVTSGVKTVARVFTGTTVDGKVWAPNASGATPTATYGWYGKGKGPLSAYASYRLPSGEAAPVGDLPGWKQQLVEDFDTNASTSTFDSVYANSWCGYADGTGGKYYKVISAVDGVQRFNLDGTRGAAGSYGPPSTCWGGLYGKYTMRFKVTGASSYGSAIMVWPSSNIWGEGEIDFPEGGFGGNMYMFQHDLNCSKCGNIAWADTGKQWTDWHTSSVEWTPSGVKYYMDGQLVQYVTNKVPFNNHRWTIQMYPTSQDFSTGTLDVDWVSYYSYNP